MKFLEAKAKQAKPAEHKMQPGVRSDQRDPEPPASIVRPDVQALADELGVDLSAVTGTGKDGAILKGDVRAQKQVMDVAAARAKEADPKTVSWPPLPHKES